MVRTQKKKNQNKRRLTEESRLHRSSSLIYTSGVVVLRCLAGQPWMGNRRGWCGHSCQALTVHCVKLVIISSLKRCPVTVLSPACSRRDGRRDLEAGCVCQGGKSLLWWGGKHYSQLYRHRLLWHIQKWPDKFAHWRWRDGRREGAAATRQSDKCLFDLLYQRHACSDWKMAPEPGSVFWIGIWAACVVECFNLFSFFKPDFLNSTFCTLSENFSL